MAVTLSTGERIEKVGYDYTSIPNKGTVAVCVHSVYGKVGSKWKLERVDVMKLAQRNLLLLTAESNVKGWMGARNRLDFKNTAWGRLPYKLTTTASDIGRKVVYEIYYPNAVSSDGVRATREYNKLKAELNKPARKKANTSPFGMVKG